MIEMQIVPVTGALGADVKGVQLAEIDDAGFSRIHQAILEHSVVFFRDQRLTPAQQVAIAHRFGGIHFHPYIEGMAEFPEIVEVIKTESDTYNFGGGWHTDQMFSERPASLTILYAREVPDAGGDTLFSSMYAAYDALSERMKTLIADLRTVNLGDSPTHRSGMSRAQRYQHAKGIRLRADVPDGLAEVIHPLVRTHAETGRKALYLGGHSHCFEGMTAAESAPLIDFLKSHAVRPEFTCRFRWEPGSMAIWDNRCAQHNAINDYQGKRRVMHRITIEGERPV